MMLASGAPIRRHLVAILSLAAASLALGSGSAGAQGTLQRIKDRGYISCGASQGVPGFSLPDASGRWTGFDVEFCRALAAEIFGTPDKARYVPLSSKDRLTALQSGEIDVLSRTTTWTLSRDTQGLNFTAVNFFDGQGFLVHKSLNVAKAQELAGASICVAQGTTNELNVADFFRAKNLKYNVVTFQAVEEVNQAYEAGRCDAYTTDRSQLAAIRLSLKQPDAHVLLPDIISKEPLGPWVRQGDDQWFDIVRWTVFALLTAEELGITQANLDEKLKSSVDPEVKRLLGTEGQYGEGLGLTNDWATRAIRAVGNYGEIYDRHLGAKSPIKLPRGPNELARNGGIHYAPPIR